MASEAAASAKPTQYELSSNAMRSKRAKSIPEFAEDWSLGESTVWKLIRIKKLRAVKIGSRTIILAEDEQEYARSLPRIGAAA